MYEVCLIQNRKDEMKKKIEVLQHTLFFNFSPPSYPLAFYTFGSPLTVLLLEVGSERFFGHGSGDPDPGSFEAVSISSVPNQGLLHVG